MDVVRIVLGVVILHEKARSVNPVIMGFSSLLGTCPSEVNMSSPFFHDLLHLATGDVLRHSIQVFVNECE
jgi:hypothetical protein